MEPQLIFGISVLLGLLIESDDLRNDFEALRSRGVTFVEATIRLAYASQRSTRTAIESPFVRGSANA
jgi:hypothetical protein